MSRHLKTNIEIDAYIASIIKQANHHAPNVQQIITPLEKAVRNVINISVDTINVYEKNGQLARSCWVTKNGNRYYFKYNYTTKKIELKMNSNRGPVLFTFDNLTTISLIQQAANSL